MFALVIFAGLFIVALGFVLLMASSTEHHSAGE
jgi:uncharacterized membrane protein